MSDCFLERRGLAYRHNGIRADRETLLFIHGLSGSASAWYPYESVLSERYNLITVDLRGHGMSKKWKRYPEYALAESAQDIRELFAHLGVLHYTIVAHSFGTLVALDLMRANDDPKDDRCDRAILLAPYSGMHRLLRTRISASILRPIVRALSSLPFRPHAGARIDYGRFIGTGDWNLRRITADVVNTTLRSYLYSLHFAYAADPDPAWRELAQPLLILHGDRDKLIPLSNTEALLPALAHARLCVLGGADHMLVINEQRAIVDAILDFVPAFESVSDATTSTSTSHASDEARSPPPFAPETVRSRSPASDS